MHSDNKAFATGSGEKENPRGASFQGHNANLNKGSLTGLQQEASSQWQHRTAQQHEEQIHLNARAPMHPGDP